VLDFFLGPVDCSCITWYCYFWSIFSQEYWWVKMSYMSAIH